MTGSELVLILFACLLSTITMNTKSAYGSYCFFFQLKNVYPPVIVSCLKKVYVQANILL